MRRSRKPVWAVSVHRGFESLPLRSFRRCLLRVRGGLGGVGGRRRRPLLAAHNRRFRGCFSRTCPARGDFGLSRALVSVIRVGVEEARGLSFEAWEQVPVPVERDRDRRVAHERVGGCWTRSSRSTAGTGDPASHCRRSRHAVRIRLEARLPPRARTSGCRGIDADVTRVADPHRAVQDGPVCICAIRSRFCGAFTLDWRALRRSVLSAPSEQLIAEVVPQAKFIVRSGDLQPRGNVALTASIVRSRVLPTRQSPTAWRSRPTT